jgi:molybdate transport system permease protein
MQTMDWGPLLLTLRVGIIATILAVVLGSIIAYWMAFHVKRGKDLLESLILMPLVLPPTVLGYFLLVILGIYSPIGKFWEMVTGHPLVFTVSGAVIAALIHALPLIIKSLSSAFTLVDTSMIESAKIEGAHGLQLLWYMYLPAVWNPLVAASTMAFARAIGDFGVTLMIAGNIPGKTQTAALAIYDYVSAGRMSEAGMMVLVICILSGFLLYATTKAGRRIN